MTLSDLAALVREALPEDLPALCGRLREAELLAELRLRSVQVSNGHSHRSQPEATEVLLTPEAAVEVIGGHLSRKWLLRHTKGLRFRRDLSRKVVRFEEGGLRRWASARRA